MLPRARRRRLIPVTPFGPPVLHAELTPIEKSAPQMQPELVDRDRYLAHVFEGATCPGAPLTREKNARRCGRYSEPFEV